MNQTTTAYNRSKVLTEEEISLLTIVRENMRRNYFTIGDIANRKIADNVANGGILTNAEIYEEIAKVLDASPRTVRYYAEVAAFFPHDVRICHEHLSFAMFASAKNVSKGVLSVAESVLEYASENVGMSASRVIAEWRAVQASKTAARMSYNEEDYQGGDVYSSTPAPMPAAEDVTTRRGLVDVLGDAVLFVRRTVAKRQDIPQAKRDRLLSIIDVLVSELNGLQ